MRGKISIQTSKSVHDVHDVHVFGIFKGHMCGNTFLNKEKKVDNLDNVDTKPGSYGPNLDEWRKISIPAWQRILEESVISNNKRRESYAKWMLNEVLKND